MLLYYYSAYRLVITSYQSRDKSIIDAADPSESDLKGQDD